MARKTERRYRRQIALAGLLDGPADDLPSMEALRAAVVKTASTPPQETSSVVAWLPLIQAKLDLGCGPTAIHQVLREEHPSFDGSLSAVKRLCKRLRAAEGPKAQDVAIPVHTAPGQQAQVDFGYVGRLRDPETDKRRKAWVFVMVLSHSRMMFAKVVFRQDVTTWLQLHREAFAFFGGVPRVVVPDNLKAAVIRAAFAASEMGTLHRSYRELAQHYGFAIDPTPAYAPQKKGKVESAVKFTKSAFFKPRADSLDRIDDVNRRLEAWVRTTANTRVHGTTGQVPAEVFAQVERPALEPLPGTPFVPVLWHRTKVGSNSHVVYGKRFYSVPWQHLGKEAWLRIRGDSVTIFVEDARVADHLRGGPTPWSTQEAHLPEGRRDWAKRDPAHWFARADALGDDVGRFVRAVMESEEVHYPLRRVQRIVPLLEGLPRDEAQAVARRAARFGCYRPDGLRRIVREGLAKEPPTESYVAPWASSPRFARQADEFLTGLEVADG